MRRLWIATAACMAISACAHTVKPSDPSKNIGSVAAAPLKDLGLVRPEAPRQLTDIGYPYDQTRLVNGCAQISFEIGTLDALLGKEFYSAQSGVGERAGQAAIGAAEGAASGLIPFRGVVRFVSGANRAQANVEHAIEMGVLRRAFLRGYGLAQGCNGLLPDAPGVRQPEPRPGAPGGPPPASQPPVGAPP